MMLKVVADLLNQEEKGKCRYRGKKRKTRKERDDGAVRLRW